MSLFGQGALDIAGHKVSYTLLAAGAGIIGAILLVLQMRNNQGAIGLGSPSGIPTDTSGSGLTPTAGPDFAASFSAISQQIAGIAAQDQIGLANLQQQISAIQPQVNAGASGASGGTSYNAGGGASLPPSPSPIQAPAPDLSNPFINTALHGGPGGGPLQGPLAAPYNPSPSDAANWNSYLAWSGGQGTGPQAAMTGLAVSTQLTNKKLLITN